MAIIRAPRPDSNFYILDKRISEDARLSWGARGMLVFLLGKPDYWAVSPAALVNETANSVKQSGRDAVYGLLRELLTSGYLHREQSKKGDGTFGGTDYMVSETPNEPADESDSPHTANPDAAPHTDLPHTAQPHTANPTLVSTDSKQGLKKAVSTEARKRAANPPTRLGLAELSAEGVDAQVAQDWLTLRNAKRLPLTQTAWDGVKTEAAQVGMSPAQAVHYAVQANWAGFKAGWVLRDGGATGGAANRSVGQPLNRQEALEAQNLEIARRAAAKFKAANKGAA